METEKIRINRDGQRDLVFVGKEIGSADNRRIRGGNDSTRWTEATLYKTAGGKYVLHRLYRTLWEGESGTEEASVFTLDELREHYADGLPNMDYSMISKAAETCPELDELLVDEIHEPDSAGGKVTTELYLAIRRTGDSLWVDTSAAAETLETAQELARFAEKAVPDLDPLARVARFRLTET